MTPSGLSSVPACAPRAAGWWGRAPESSLPRRLLSRARRACGSPLPSSTAGMRAGVWGACMDLGHCVQCLPKPSHRCLGSLDRDRQSERMRLYPAPRHGDRPGHMSLVLALPRAARGGPRLPCDRDVAWQATTLHLFSEGDRGLRLRPFNRFSTPRHRRVDGNHVGGLSLLP